MSPASDVAASLQAEAAKDQKRGPGDPQRADFAQLTLRMKTHGIMGQRHDTRGYHTNKIARQYLSEFLGSLARGKVHASSQVALWDNKKQSRPAGTDEGPQMNWHHLICAHRTERLAVHVL